MQDGYELRKVDGGWQMWMENDECVAYYTGILIQKDDFDDADFLAAQIMDGMNIRLL